jgi:ABC-type phosphate/phosphonate transport system substrate-binding protein
MLKGWAAAGATYASRNLRGDVVSSGWRDNLGERAGEVVALWFSAPIPGDSIAHRPFLPDALATALTGAMLGMTDCDEGRALLADIFNAESLVRGDVRDYDDVRSALGA